MQQEPTQHGHADLASLVQSLQAESQQLIDGLRIRRIKDLHLLERKLDENFRDLTVVAAGACNAQSAQITVIDDLLLHIKMQTGAPFPAIVDRYASICNTTIQSPDTLTVIADTLQDDRFKDRPFAKDDVVRFYAGAPLVLQPDNVPIGAICVFDGEPREMSARQREVLLALARLVTSLLGRAQ